MARSTDRSTGPAGLPRPELPPLRHQLIRFGLLLLLAVVVTVVAAVVIPHLRRDTLLAVGTPAPKLDLAAAEGGHQGLAAGTATVVEFFETSCPHCQAEAPALCGLARSHPAVRFLGVDAGLDSADAITGFRRDHLPACDASRFPLLLDPGDTVTHSWSVGAVPTVYVVGADGRITYAGEGEGGVGGLSAALAGSGG